MNPSPATKTLRVDLPQNIQVSQQTLRRFVCFAETNLVVVVRGSALNKHIIIISLFKALPWTTTTKLINSHQKKLMENSFSFKCRCFHWTGTIYPLPKRKKYALAGFTKSTRCLFQYWRGETKLFFTVLVFNFLHSLQNDFFLS